MIFCIMWIKLQNMDDSDWTNSLYPSPLSVLGDGSFTDEMNMSAVMLKEEDPGEAGNTHTHAYTDRQLFFRPFGSVMT